MIHLRGELFLRADMFQEGGPGRHAIVRVELDDDVIDVSCGGDDLPKEHPPDPLAPMRREDVDARFAQVLVRVGVKPRQKTPPDEASVGCARQPVARSKHLGTVAYSSREDRDGPGRIFRDALAGHLVAEIVDFA